MLLLQVLPTVTALIGGAGLFDVIHVYSLPRDSSSLNSLNLPPS